MNGAGIGSGNRLPQGTVFVARPSEISSVVVTTKVSKEQSVAVASQPDVVISKKVVRKIGNINLNLIFPRLIIESESLSPDKNIFQPVKLFQRLIMIFSFCYY